MTPINLHPAEAPKEEGYYWVLWACRRDEEESLYYGATIEVVRIDGEHGIAYISDQGCCAEERNLPYAVEGSNGFFEAAVTFEGPIQKPLWPAAKLSAFED